MKLGGDFYKTNKESMSSRSVTEIANLSFLYILFGNLSYRDVGNFTFSGILLTFASVFNIWLLINYSFTRPAVKLGGFLNYYMVI